LPRDWKVKAWRIAAHHRRRPVVTLKGSALAMATNEIGQYLAMGAIVNIRNSGYRKGKIVEFRGQLGPGGRPANEAGGS